MIIKKKKPGVLMAAESAECMAVFAASAAQSVNPAKLGRPKALYTIARGSSDAAANILSYEFMRELGIPVTSLPPSVFSLGNGVSLKDAGAMVISQSGASDDLVQSAKRAAKAGAKVLAITNQADSPVEAVSHATVSIGAGPELAVPATKSVVGSVAAGMAVLGAMKPYYAERAAHSIQEIEGRSVQHPQSNTIQAAFLRARHVYVIGRASC